MHLSDTQIIARYPPYGQRLGNFPRKNAPLHLLGEVETLMPFNPDGTAVPKNYWFERRVLVAPGYGNLPFQLLFLGAREVVGVDIDPLTIAYQRKKIGLGELLNAEERLLCAVAPTARAGIIDRLMHRIETETKPKREHLKNISFYTQDLQLPLSDDLGKFSLIVVPYLIGMNNGVENETIVTVLENLSRRLEPDGAILVQPYSMMKDGEVSTVCYVDDFCKQHHFTIERSTFSPLYAMISNSQCLGAYGLLRPRTQVSPP